MFDEPKKLPELSILTDEFKEGLRQIQDDLYFGLWFLMRVTDQIDTMWINISYIQYPSRHLT